MITTHSAPMHLVSVIVVARNKRTSLQRCIDSILQNVHPAIEVIVVDDASDDGTAVDADPRVKVLRNTVRVGPAASRNRAIQVSQGDFLFFVDADCTVCPQWIQMGLEALVQPGVVAVEGEIHYARPRPSILNKVPVNPFYNLETDGALTAPHRDFCAGNFAAGRAVLLKVGGFDAERYPNGREDTDLGIRLLAEGEIRFEHEMKVVHEEETWSLRSLLANALRYSADVVYCKDHGSFPFRAGYFLHPRLLAMLLFPPLIPLRFQLDSPRAWWFAGSLYLYLLTLRLVIWRTAIRERILLL